MICKSSNGLAVKYVECLFNLKEKARLSHLLPPPRSHFLRPHLRRCRLPPLLNRCCPRPGYLLGGDSGLVKLRKKRQLIGQPECDVCFCIPTSFNGFVFLLVLQEVRVHLKHI